MRSSWRTRSAALGKLANDVSLEGHALDPSSPPGFLIRPSYPPLSLPGFHISSLRDLETCVAGKARFEEAFQPTPSKMP